MSDYDVIREIHTRWESKRSDLLESADEMDTKIRLIREKLSDDMEHPPLLEDWMLYFFGLTVSALGVMVTIARELNEANMWLDVLVSSRPAGDDSTIRDIVLGPNGKDVD